MATLHDIQVRLDTDLSKLKDQEYVKKTLWSDIKDMLTQVTDFDEVYPGDMRKLIYQWLNEQGLQGTPTEKINLNRLKGALQTGTVQVPQPEEVPNTWLPW
jgi:hypothetical protein